MTGKLPLSASQSTNPQSDHKTYAWAILLTDISNIHVQKRDQVYIHVHFRIFLASFIYFECVLNIFIIVWRLEDCNVMRKCGRYCTHVDFCKCIDLWRNHFLTVGDYIYLQKQERWQCPEVI